MVGLNLNKNEHLILCQNVHSGTAYIATYHHHGNGEVGSELVVTPGARSPKTVLVDASFVDQLWLFLLRILWIMGNVELLLKILLDVTIPLHIWHRICLSWNQTFRMKKTWFNDGYRDCKIHSSVKLNDHTCSEENVQTEAASCNFLWCDLVSLPIIPDGREHLIWSWFQPILNCYCIKQRLSQNMCLKNSWDQRQGWSTPSVP